MNEDFDTGLNFEDLERDAALALITALRSRLDRAISEGDFCSATALWACIVAISEGNEDKAMDAMAAWSPEDEGESE